MRLSSGSERGRRGFGGVGDFDAHATLAEAC